MREDARSFNEPARGTRGLPPLLVVIVAAAAAALTTPAPAVAAVLMTPATCEVPVTGRYDVGFKTDFAIPATMGAGTRQQFPVNTTLTLPEDLQRVLRLIGVATVEPKQISFSTLVDPVPSSVAQPRASGPAVSLPEAPSGPLTLTATGTQVVVAPVYDGPMAFTLRSPIEFGVIFRDPAGEEIRLYDDSLPDTDQDRSFTEVSCGFAASPAVIGSTTIVAPVPDAVDFFGNTRTARSITMNWYPPESHVANTRYVVTQRILSGPFYGDTISQTTTGTSATFSGLAPERFYGYTIRAETSSGSSTESPEYVAVTAPLSHPPSKPTGLRATGVTDRALQLSWDAAADDLNAVVGYDVYQDDVKLDRVGNLTKEITGLRAGATYRFRVVAIDDSGNETSSDEVAATTGLGTPRPLSFATSGRAALPSLVSDSFTISGSLQEDIYPSGLVTGSMRLFDRTLDLRSTSGLPVRGRIVIVPVGEFEGTASASSTQTLRQKLRVKIPEAKVYGVPVANLGNCQTRAASTATFSSTGKVLASGGSLVGTFPLSGFTGCASLNGIVDLGTSTGNSIALTLTGP